MLDSEQAKLYLERDYHQPSDEIDDEWNLDGAVADARWFIDIGWRIAILTRRFV